MKSKLYAADLLKKLVSKKELEILEIVSDEEQSQDQKIDALLGEE
jgi:hypothetical protein